MHAIRTALQIDVRQARSDALTPAAEAAAAGPPSPAASQPILDFISSDETLDRYGDVICASGWRLETYRRNPVFQNAHQYGDIIFTLGKALITEVRSLPLATPHSASVTVLFQRIQFATDVNPIARVAYGLYKAGFLKAVSVGFIPLRWQEADGTERYAHKCADLPAQPDSFRRLRIAPGQNLALAATQHFHRRFLEQELLEVSAVGIPANPNALALGLKAGAIERGDLRETLELLSKPTNAKATNSWEPTLAADQRERFRLARELHRILRSA